MNRKINPNEPNKKNVCVTLSDRNIKCLELFSSYIGLSKSAIIGLALNDYFMRNPELRNNPSFIEIVGKKEISLWKKENRLKTKIETEEKK